MVSSSANPPLDQVIDAMLKALQDYIPPPINGLPQPGLLVASVNERTVGLNNFIGTETRTAFPVISRKGIRLDALVRFQIWGADPVQLDTVFSKLDGHLMADRDALRGNGFLRLSLENTATADQIFSFSAWRKQADYRILYEYRFQDANDAAGLIAKITIDSVPEESSLLAHEIMNVTDRMARWDNLSAPPFVVRGRFSIGGLAALQFISDAAPIGTITLTRTADTVTGPPTVLPTLQDFLADVAGPTATSNNSQVTFTTLNLFLSNFSSAGTPFALGDWDANNIPDSYTSFFLPIEPAIVLPSGFDRLEISYQGNVFDKVAIVYLRAISG